MAAAVPAVDWPELAVESVPSAADLGRSAADPGRSTADWVVSEGAESDWLEAGSACLAAESDRSTVELAPRWVAGEDLPDVAEGVADVA